MSETLPIDYLKNYSIHVPLITPVIEAHRSIKTVPPALVGKPYQLLFSIKEKDTYELEEKYENLSIDVIPLDDENRSLDTGLFLSVSLYHDRIDIIGFGRNNLHPKVYTGENSVENLFGILGPYEDACCQSYANLYQREVKRKVSTAYLETSRLVQQYSMRGYTTRSVSGGGISLSKDFFPNI